MEICRMVEENSREGDVVFVPDARLADLIFAVTGRPVTEGMFREVEPEVRSDPQGAALIVVRDVQRPGPRGVIEQGPAVGLEAPAGAASGELVGRAGGYSVFRNEDYGSTVTPAGAALPMWAAWLFLALAALLVACDAFLYQRARGEGDPGGGGEGPAGGKGGGEGRLMVAVPCLNEEATVAGVVAEVRESHPGCRVLVVDDGSRDDTASRARRAGAEVVSNPRNLGIGAGLKRAMTVALRGGHPFLVRLDGDGQHDPAFIGPLLEPLQEGRADAVIGSRYLSKEGGADISTTALRRLSRKAFSCVLWMYTGRTFTDPNSGMWAFNRQAMRALLTVDLRRFPESEMLMVLERAGLRVEEVPVRMRPRGAGHSSLNLRRALSYLLELGLGPLFDPRDRWEAGPRARSAAFS